MAHPIPDEPFDVPAVPSVRSTAPTRAQLDRMHEADLEARDLAVPAIDGRSIDPRHWSKYESLLEQEELIERGVRAFVQIGHALRRIHDRELHLVTHASFDAYLLERWGISRSQGYRLMDAAWVADLVSPIGEPRNELQVRPLVGLLRADPEGEAVREVWQSLVAEHGGTSFTGKTVTEALMLRYPSTDPDPLPEHEHGVPAYVQVWLAEATDEELDALDALVRARRTAERDAASK